MHKTTQRKVTFFSMRAKHANDSARGFMRMGEIEEARKQLRKAADAIADAEAATYGWADYAEQCEKGFA